jgi:hypothetical protein
MRRVRIPSLCCLLTALSCPWTLRAEKPESKAADLIIGKWLGDGSIVVIKDFKDKDKDKVYVRKATVEFRKDGTFKWVNGDLPELKDISPSLVKGDTMMGKYSFVTATEMEAVVKEDGKESKRRVKVEVTRDELMLTAPGEKKPLKFKRVKE